MSKSGGAVTLSQWEPKEVWRFDSVIKCGVTVIFYYYSECSFRQAAWSTQTTKREKRSKQTRLSDLLVCTHSSTQKKTSRLLKKDVKHKSQQDKALRTLPAHSACVVQFPVLLTDILWLYCTVYLVLISAIAWYSQRPDRKIFKKALNSRLPSMCNKYLMFRTLDANYQK